MKNRKVNNCITNQIFLTSFLSPFTIRQIKTHAQKYHAKNNAEVQQKYREHLLPNTKLTFRKIILPLTKNADSLSHPIQKLTC